MRHIAVVEDVPDNRFILRVFLEHYFKVTEFESGRRFTAELSNLKFDAVILDISMPEMDGFEVLRVLKNKPAWTSVPVIAVTAHAMQGDRERALEAGFWDYVVKPFDCDELITSVFRQVEKSCQRAGA